jgi:hypothetical protein
VTDLLHLSRRVAAPSVIYTAGGQAHLEAADALGDITARIRALNPAAAGFAVSEQAWPGAYPGLDLFFSWSVYALAPDGSRDWVASVLVPAPRDRDPAFRVALIAALVAHAPQRAAA